MAIKRNITESDQVFFDTDRLLRYTVYAGRPTQSQIAAGEATLQDVTGYALAWVLSQAPPGTAPIIAKATGGHGVTVVGTFNADPAVNTQRVEVRIDDTDTYDPDTTPAQKLVPGGKYPYALKRTDPGHEDVLGWGLIEFTPQAARE